MAIAYLETTIPSWRRSMTKDPIVEEVHRTREKLLAECGGDLDRLMDYLQECEGEERGVVIKTVRELKPPARALAS